MSLVDEAGRTKQSTKQAVNQNAQQDEECAICLDKPSNPLLLSCAHTFCKKCVTNLIGAERNACCPLCRTPLTSGDQAKAQQ
jgi:SWI/SNF-related matrix-associated actin-dependent regulator of chromatin subfamily A3